MERESSPKSSSLAAMAGDTVRASAWSRSLLLLCLMLLPWVCAGIGLFVVRDYRLTMLMYGVLCCTLPTLLFRQHAISFWPPKVNLLRLFGTVAGLNLLLLGVFQVTRFGIEATAFHERATGIHLLFNRQIIEYGLYFVIMNPLLEETFWRGFIYEEWKRIVPLWPPVWALVLAIAVMLGGILFTMLYEKTGTLGASIIVHGLGTDLPLLLIVLTLLTR